MEHIIETEQKLEALAVLGIDLNVEALNAVPINVFRQGERAEITGAQDHAFDAEMILVPEWEMIFHPPSPDVPAA
jgi:hypothetical protein